MKKEEDSDGSLDYYVCKKHTDAIVLFKVQCPFCGMQQVQKHPFAKALQEQHLVQNPPPERPKTAPPPKEEQMKLAPKVLENTISLKMTPKIRHVRKKEVTIAPPVSTKLKSRAKKLIQERRQRAT